MTTDSPIKGPFPDGDARNVTLVKSQHKIEPDRTGPQEPGLREEGALDTVLGDLAPPGYEQKAGRRADDGEGAEMGFGSVGGAIDPVALGDSEDDPATRVRTDAARPLSGE